MQVKEIDVSELKNRLDAGEDLVLLDIRSAAEVQQGVLPIRSTCPCI